MKFRDRIRKDRALFSSLSREEKALFLWDYYKIPILALLCALLLLTVCLTMGARQKAVALYAVFINTDSTRQPDGAALDSLLERAGIDMERRRVDVDAGMTLGSEELLATDGQTIQVLAALFGISGLDVFAADEASFARYSAQDAFVDLSLFLEPELLEHACRYENAEGRTIAGGLVLKPGSPLHEAGYFRGSVVIGVAANAENLEEAVAFVRQLALESMG